MDPDTTLKQMLSIAEDILDADDGATDLAELVVSLDDWMRGGGFLPKRWRERP